MITHNSFAVRLAENVSSIYSNSFFSNFLSNALNFINNSYDNSFVRLFFRKAAFFIRESSVAKWLMREEEEIDVFSSSKSLEKGISVGESVFCSAESAYKESFANNLVSGVAKELASRPVFSISLILFAAVITNSVLWLFLGDFKVSGFLARLALALASFIGLYSKK
ncbi:hypothetical protein D6745_04850 [Candidatus Woesearchaeota archaeon]|nr:MAG: hypothetical protein D6745_04850 [Candidatus Woesearchaeota archaeon]